MSPLSRPLCAFRGALQHRKSASSQALSAQFSPSLGPPTIMSTFPTMILRTLGPPTFPSMLGSEPPTRHEPFGYPLVGFLLTRVVECVFRRCERCGQLRATRRWRRVATSFLSSREVWKMETRRIFLRERYNCPGVMARRVRAARAFNESAIFLRGAKT